MTTAKVSALRPVPVDQARRLAAQTGGSLLAVIVVDRDGKQCAITTWGQTRAECRALKRWSEHEGDDVAGAMLAWAAVEGR
jgi:hypothetical protein